MTSIPVTSARSPGKSRFLSTSSFASRSNSHVAAFPWTRNGASRPRQPASAPIAATSAWSLCAWVNRMSVIARGATSHSASRQATVGPQSTSTTPFTAMLAYVRMLGPPRSLAPRQLAQSHVKAAS